eukprot:COSAG01_NODE_6733_length_3524_cov_2.038832_4_plen_219_part_00
MHHRARSHFASLQEWSRRRGGAGIDITESGTATPALHSTMRESPALATTAVPPIRTATTCSRTPSCRQAMPPRVSLLICTTNTGGSQRGWPNSRQLLTAVHPAVSAGDTMHPPLLPLALPARAVEGTCTIALAAAACSGGGGGCPAPGPGAAPRVGCASPAVAGPASRRRCLLAPCAAAAGSDTDTAVASASAAADAPACAARGRHRRRLKTRWNPSQ